jgi:succinyl-CoA synthetase alpha subunit
MLFSDNVPVEDEVALKMLARQRGLLMMGPDCGTAILNGKPLAFANVVRRGSIGVVGASGTGIQEIVCVVHRLGGGISQAIGTGGRDLSEKVGGLMTLGGIEALAADPTTRVIVVVSKPPAPAVAEKVIGALRKAGKRSVAHFVGGAKEPDGESKSGLIFATSLAGVAEEACRLAGVNVSAEAARLFDDDLPKMLADELARGALLRGLFCGGTTGQEAVALLERAGEPVYSNFQNSDPRHTDGTLPVEGHVVLDLGADEFTVGRPHPMIEPELRNERLTVEMENPKIGVLLFDVVLGYGSHPNPAGVLAEGIAQARAAAASRLNPESRAIVAIASITGTDQDPQDFARQRRVLESAGVVVMPDNRSAVALAAAVLRRNA